MLRTTLTLFATVLLALGGCAEQEPSAPAGQGSVPSAAPGGAAATAPQSGAALRVAADKTHAVQPGDVITVSVTVTGFELDSERIGAANEAGVGHYRVYLDGATGDEYLAESAGSYTTIVLPQDTTDGTHDLRVVLHNNDRSVLVPAVEASVSLIVYRL